jgi:hypothetical protein
MLNKKLGFATLALGSFLTLLGPTAALADDRSRDNNRQRDDRSYTESFSNRRPNIQQELARRRFERERFLQQRNRNRSYVNNYSNRNSYGFQNSRGYYDKTGRWHPSF